MRYTWLRNPAGMLVGRGVTRCPRTTAGPMAFQIILLTVLLGLSAFFSGSETVLFALSRHELSLFSKDHRASHRLVADLMKRPRQLLLTLMIGNVTLNMFVFATALAILDGLPRGWAAYAPVLGLLSPVLVTVLTDIVPKGTGMVSRTWLAPRLAPPVRLFQLGLTPLRMVLNGLLVEPLTRLLIGGRQPDEYVTVEELRELMEMCERQRLIGADENAMLSEVIHLSELKVRDVMIPRVDMTAFELYDDPEELARIFRERRFPKLPVYEESIDHIRGVVYAKDFFLDRDAALADLVRPVHFVPELITLTQVLAHFRRTRSQMAIAVDEYGGVVGLVSIEDVAEQIVGDLTLPGEDPERKLWEKIDARHYRVWGGVSIRDWSEQFDIRRIDERATTLAGLLVAKLGRVPAAGDQVRLGNLLLTVESLTGHRVEWILLELFNGEAPGGPAPDGERGQSS